MKSEAKSEQNICLCFKVYERKCDNLCDLVWAILKSLKEAGVPKRIKKKVRIKFKKNEVLLGSFLKAVSYWNHRFSSTSKT